MIGRPRAFAARVVSVLAGCLAASAIAAVDEAAWRALAGPGTHLIMRHALAPGTGDPAGLVGVDCATQRNLSDHGRKEAERFGRAVAWRGIRPDRIMSSQWCRCLETARLLDLGPVEPLPALNSFYEERTREAERMRALRSFLASLDAGRKIFMISHQVNVTALTGIYPESGEAVVFRIDASGAVSVLGRIAPLE